MWCQAMSLFVAMILRALGPYHGNCYDSDDEYLSARLPLLRNQVQHTQYVGDPSVQCRKWFPECKYLPSFLLLCFFKVKLHKYLDPLARVTTQNQSFALQNFPWFPRITFSLGLCLWLVYRLEVTSLQKDSVETSIPCILVEFQLWQMGTCGL